MSVIRSFEETGPCKTEIEVEVPPAAVEAETDRVIAVYRKRAKLPGFRPGKAPKSVVVQRFKEEIDQEVVDRLVPRYFEQALAEKELEPLIAPRVEKVDHAPGLSLSFVASVETRPEIALDDLEGFELPDPPVEPTPAEVDEALEQLRKDVATWVSVERAAAQGDLVTVEIRDHSKDEDPQTVPFEVGDSNVWEELSLAVTGKSEGQSAEFEKAVTPAPAADGEPQEVPEPGRYSLTVSSVKERELPELDDEMARKVGEFESFADLEAEVRRRVQLGKERERGEAREKALLEQLVRRHPLTLPEGAVKQETEELLADYAERLARQGVDLENAEVDWQKLGTDLQPQAERRVQIRLLLDAVGERLGLEIGDDELGRALHSIARLQGRSAAELRQALQSNGRLSALRDDLRRRKSIRTLLGEEVDEADAAIETSPRGEVSDLEAADHEPGDPADEEE